jgi:hypothetical protein
VVAESALRVPTVTAVPRRPKKKAGGAAGTGRPSPSSKKGARGKRSPAGAAAAAAAAAAAVDPGSRRSKNREPHASSPLLPPTRPGLKAGSSASSPSDGHAATPPRPRPASALITGRPPGPIRGPGPGSPTGAGALAVGGSAAGVTGPLIAHQLPIHARPPPAEQGLGSSIGSSIGSSVGSSVGRNTNGKATGGNGGGAAKIVSGDEPRQMYHEIGNRNNAKVVGAVATTNAEQHARPASPASKFADAPRFTGKLETPALTVAAVLEREMRKREAAAAAPQCDDHSIGSNYDSDDAGSGGTGTGTGGGGSSALAQPDSPPLSGW